MADPDEPPEGVHFDVRLRGLEILGALAFAGGCALIAAFIIWQASTIF